MCVCVRVRVGVSKLIHSMCVLIVLHFIIHPCLLICIVVASVCLLGDCFVTVARVCAIAASFVDLCG